MAAKRVNPTESLLGGRPYTPAASTDVAKTWLSFGWVPPSRDAQQEVMQRLNPMSVSQRLAP
jgi:hypothetical protein